MPSRLYLAMRGERDGRSMKGRERDTAREKERGSRVVHSLNTRDIRTVRSWEQGWRREFINWRSLG